MRNTDSAELGEEGKKEIANYFDSIGTQWNGKRLASEAHQKTQKDTREKTHTHTILTDRDWHKEREKVESSEC